MFKKLLSLICCILICCSNTQSTRICSQPYKKLGNPVKQPVTLFIDKAFSKSQENDIWNAANAWEKACDKVSFVIYFKMNRPGLFKNNYGTDYKNNAVFMWIVNKNDKHEIGDRLLEKMKGWNGGFDYHSNVVIFKNNINSDYNVILHELGHVLGLKHTSKKIHSVMHPYATSNCITDEDEKQLVNLYGCSFKPECESYIVNYD